MEAIADGTLLSVDDINILMESYRADGGTYSNIAQLSLYV